MNCTQINNVQNLSRCRTKLHARADAMMGEPQKNVEAHFGKVPKFSSKQIYVFYGLEALPDDLMQMCFSISPAFLATLWDLGSNSGNSETTGPQFSKATNDFGPPA
ncbi:hypothetical protein KIL84_010846 [Mauremys mutica]|uniref:Uncharacterized protein n=1 Tax=Mauremys mutica TaxID=74926 RepID=A0A9D3X8E9_9SAUR|nr:hypothetical protein KIL84_010846 [Mauremys mutica]